MKKINRIVGAIDNIFNVVKIFLLELKILIQM